MLKKLLGEVRRVSLSCLANQGLCTGRGVRLTRGGGGGVCMIRECLTGSTLGIEAETRSGGEGGGGGLCENAWRDLPWG